ncbi:DUF6666 family protein [Rosistilla carotiformis]|nr:DUF6666 family protein [Rosistilla carotiformis]
MILTNLSAVAEDQSIPTNRLRAPVKPKQTWVPEANPPVQPVAATQVVETDPKAETLVSQPQRAVSANRQYATAPQPAAIGTGAAKARASAAVRRPAPKSQSPNWLGVRQVGYNEHYIPGDVGGYVEAGPSCGCDSCSGGIGMAYEPGCGFEPACGFEPSCGFEGAGCTGDACGIGCGCNACIEPGCGPCDPFGWWDWRRTEFFVGVQGFKGPPNFASGNTAGQRDGSASFGFHQGFNLGRPLYFIGCGEFGWQFGLRATQSNLSGAEFTTDERTQLFLTGGVYRRVDCGWQGGVVVDYLSDQWYYDVDLLQIRGELSWKVSPVNEFGFRMSQSTQTSGSVAQLLDDAGLTTTTEAGFLATDQYRFFHRRTMGNGVEVEGNVGFSGSSDVILGASFDVPMGRCLALRTGFDYLIPDDGSNANGNQQEGWNMGMSFVWTPGGRIAGGRDYYRPLFNVADNGSFMVDRR